MISSPREPKDLAGTPKTCPRRDCPNPTIGIHFKGSASQLQYHCYGCWRVFNLGGVQRHWVKRVPPPKSWLREQAPHQKKAPRLLPLGLTSSSSGSTSGVNEQQLLESSQLLDSRTPLTQESSIFELKNNVPEVARLSSNEEGQSATHSAGDDGIGDDPPCIPMEENLDKSLVGTLPADLFDGGNFGVTLVSSGSDKYDPWDSLSFHDDSFLEPWYTGI